MKFTRLFNRAIWALAIMAFGAIPHAAQAALMFDVQLSSGGLNTGLKTATITSVGQVVNLDIYAIITSPGTNGFQSAAGALRSSTGGLLGNLTHALQSPFNAPGSVAGTLQDLVSPNNDTDLDVGPNSLAVANDSTGAIIYRAAGSTPGSVHWLGTATFTVNSQTLTAGLTTDINFLLGSPTQFNQNPLWTENNTPLNALSGTELIGLPVTLSVAAIPEPGTIALGGMLLAGLAGWKLRRKKA